MNLMAFGSHLALFIMFWQINENDSRITLIRNTTTVAKQQVGRLFGLFPCGGVLESIYEFNGLWLSFGTFSSTRRGN